MKEEVLNYYKNDNEKYEKSMINQFNKEQLETTFHKSYQRYKNHKVLLDYIIELQDRINKAIKYIENKQKLNIMFSNITLNKDSQKELLAILKGDNNE